MNHFNNFIILTIILFVILFCLLIRKNKMIKESFNICDPCYFPSSPGVFMRNNRVTCRLDECDVDGRNIRENHSRRWNNGKSNTIIFYCQKYVNRLKDLNFGNFESQGSYSNTLNQYLRDLNNQFKKYIDKLSSYSWQVRYDRDFDRSRADTALNIVGQCHQTLSDLRSVNTFINTNYKTDAEDIPGKWNNNIQQLYNRIKNYRYRPQDYFNKYSRVLSNNFTGSNSMFWRAVWKSYHCLENLRILMSFYPNSPEMGKVKDSLNSYKEHFNGKYFKVYNITTNDMKEKDHIYNYLKKKLAGYAGNQYQKTAQIKDSNIDDVNQLPFKHRVRAYNNFQYETLGSCQREYANFDNLEKYQTRYRQMNDTKERIELSNYTNNVNDQKNTINHTKSMFWKDDGSTWRPNQSVDDHSHCKPPDENNIISNPPISESSIFNFKNKTDDLETKRKKIQYCRKDVFSSLVGQDTQIRIGEPLPNVCPLLNNQDDEVILDWSRAEDSLQPDICKSKNSFANEPNSFLVEGTMKPGSIINGNDQWIENYNNITSKVDMLEAITDSTSEYDFQKDNLGRTYLGKDKKHTILIRTAGAMKERILKDRDWTLSTQKWDEKNESREINNFSYFINEYLKMYQNYLIVDSSIFNFTIHFEIDSQMEKYSSSIIFISDISLKVSNLKIKSDENNLGIVKIYHNMYKYSYHLTNTNHPTIILPTFQDKELSLFSIIYDNLNWEKDELIEFGHDLYFICSNNSEPHKLYQNSNGFLFRNNESKFGKLYYSSKNNTKTPNKDFVWSIFKDPDNGYDMIYHKSTQTFLALGINFQLGNNFNLDSGIDLANQNLDDSKVFREPTLYFVKKEILESLKKSTDMKDKFTYNNMFMDCSWNILKDFNNRYSIKHAFSDDILWFSLTSFKVKNTSIDTSDVTVPLNNKTGYISFSKQTMDEEESNDYAFCDNKIGDKCYNMFFYIVPVEPEDVTNQFSISGEIKERDLFNTCPNPNGNNTLDNNKWFFEISETNQIPFADQDRDSNNPYKNIYSMYGDNGDFRTGVLRLDGGGGKECSESIYCNVKKKLLNSDKSDKTINPTMSDTPFSNKQVESRNLSIKVKDDKNKPITKNYPVPLNKYDYQCVRNQFNIYKLFGNKTTIDFNSTLNPNVKNPADDSYNKNDSNRVVAVSIYSTNESYIEGIDFGMSPDGTFVWFVTFLENKNRNRTHLDVGSLKIIKKSTRGLYNKFITITNAKIPSSLKRERQKIITKFDQLKFENIGYSNFGRNKVYAYKNTASSFLE